MSNGISSAAVIGSGVMGSAIAAQFAGAGIQTHLLDVVPRDLPPGSEADSKARNRLADEAITRALKTKPAPFYLPDHTRLIKTGNLEDHLDRLKGCDLVIEAIVENLEEKRKVFSELDRVTPPRAILASNTSSISITSMAAATKRPDKCLGLHFMNPVPIMKLVEIVRPEITSEETYREARAFTESLGKTVVTAKDTPGFLVNLLLVPYLCEAVRAVDQGLATKEDVDASMKLGCGMPMGPIELLDFVGLDTTLYIMDVLFDAYREAKYAAPPLLRRMVAAGRMGKKAGRGFYEYAK
jgi:3-hydroxybutyryl-CoA dehydrogenase